MAKSLRSKWKRKCRAVKRVRYGAKELERLKSILKVNDATPKLEENSEISEIAELKTIEEIKLQNEKSTEDMQVEDEAAVKELKNKNGKYPIWLHPRKIPKKSKKSKKSKVKRKGKGRK